MFSGICTSLSSSRRRPSAFPAPLVRSCFHCCLLSAVRTCIHRREMNSSPACSYLCTAFALGYSFVYSLRPRGMPLLLLLYVDHLRYWYMFSVFCCLMFVVKLRCSCILYTNVLPLQTPGTHVECMTQCEECLDDVGTYTCVGSPGVLLL